MNYKKKFLSNCIKVTLLRNFEFLCLSKFSHRVLRRKIDHRSRVASHKTLVKSTSGSSIDLQNSRGEISTGVTTTPWQRARKTSILPCDGHRYQGRSVERVNHGTANIFVFYKVHGVWLTGSISPCRSVVSVYVAAGSEGAASKDATSAAGAPFPPSSLPPLSILRNSAPRFFILLFPLYICIYIRGSKEGRKERVRAEVWASRWKIPPGNGLFKSVEWILARGGWKRERKKRKSLLDRRRSFDTETPTG